MTDLLRNQTVVITGAGRGIGRAVAIACAAEGANVVLNSRTRSSLDETARIIAEAGGTARSVAGDVTNSDDVRNLVDTAEREFGPVDLMVNNAGTLDAIGPTWETDPDAWWKVLEVNLRGLYLCNHEILPRMIGRGSGRVINFVGGGTTVPFPFSSAYATSKAAVMRLSENIDRELASEGIEGVKVFAMSPGFVRTGMTEQFGTEEGKRWMSFMAKRLEAGDYIPPERAGELVVRIGSGAVDALHGRYITAARDLDTLDDIVADAERIEKEDLRALRIT